MFSSSYLFSILIDFLHQARVVPQRKKEPKYCFYMLIMPSNEPKKKKKSIKYFGENPILKFLLHKAMSKLEAKLLNKVPREPR